MKKTKIALVIIIFIASFLRLYDLPCADVITDEALIGFRSIGYLDFFASLDQSTPLEWFDPSTSSGQGIPGWVKLSFHDHPPLTFLLQHFSFLIFGVNAWGLRLPFALAGIASVYLVYLIAVRLAEMFSESRILPLRQTSKSGMTKEEIKSFSHSEVVGLLSAALLSVNDYHVWISRIGLQESLVVFFSLTAVWLFLKFLENPKKEWWKLGAALGLAFLTKYTTFVLVPALIAVCFLCRSFVGAENFQPKRLVRYGMYALCVSIVVFSPVIIYNVMLFQTRGHFDLQFAYLFGQSVPGWDVLLGKVARGSFLDRITGIVPTLMGVLSPVFWWGTVAVFFYGLLSFFACWFPGLSFRLKRSGMEKSLTKFNSHNDDRSLPSTSSGQAARDDKESNALTNSFNGSITVIIIFVIFYILSFFTLGTSQRFMVVLVPFLCILFSIVIVFLIESLRSYRSANAGLQDTSKKKTSRIFVFMLSCFIVFMILWELFFTWNTLFSARPWPVESGANFAQARVLPYEGVTWSRLKLDSFQWGYNELGEWIDELYRDRYSVFTFPLQYQFLEDLKDDFFERAEKEGREARSVLLVYDENMYGLARLWYIVRYNVYEGWSMMSAGQYGQILKENGDMFFRDQGIEETVYIKASDRVLLELEPSSVPAILEEWFETQGAEKISIENSFGEEVFWVYRL